MKSSIEAHGFFYCRKKSERSPPSEYINSTPFHKKKMVLGLEPLRTDIHTWHPSVFLLPIRIREFPDANQQEFTLDIDGRRLFVEVRCNTGTDRISVHFSMHGMQHSKVLWKAIKNGDEQIRINEMHSPVTRWCVAAYDVTAPMPLITTFVLRFFSAEHWKRFEGRPDSWAQLLHGIGSVADISKGDMSKSRMRSLLLNAPTDGDVVFMVAGERIAAHSFIIKHFLPVPLLYSCMNEGVSNEVVIEDTKPEVFRAFLEYLYTQDDVDDETAIIGQHTTDLLVLANKYGYERLHRLCDFHLARQALSWPRPEQSVFELLVFADRHQAAKLKDACLERLMIEDEELDTEELDVLDKQLLMETLRDVVQRKRRKQTHSLRLEEQL